MKKITTALSCLALFTSHQLLATTEKTSVRSPGEIIQQSSSQDWRKVDNNQVLYMELESGRVVIELLPEAAPNHVANIKALAREQFYNGLSLYRVIDGFVAQGGAGESEKQPKQAKPTVNAEFSFTTTKDFNPVLLDGPDGYAKHNGFYKGFAVSMNSDKSSAWITHCPGVFAMARSNDVNSGGTEFYITFGSQRYLDNNITVFGRVLDGMEQVQKLVRSQALGGSRDMTGKNLIKSVTVASDLPKEQQLKLEVMVSQSAAFKEMIKSRSNRPEAWFINKPDYIDICQMPVPIRISK